VAFAPVLFWYESAHFTVSPGRAVPCAPVAESAVELSRWFVPVLLKSDTGVEAACAAPLVSTDALANPTTSVSTEATAVQRRGDRTVDRWRLRGAATAACLGT
jgi:hypothetical protein